LGLGPQGEQVPKRITLETVTITKDNAAKFVGG
jgi:hypothetical protein